MAKHTNDTPSCLKCDELLNQCDPELANWFRAHRLIDLELHVSCGRRDRVAQEAAFNGGQSKAPYGKSPHNYNPSMAIDLFWVVGGKAVWDRDRYQLLRKSMPASLQWGGDFQGPFKDRPHWQVKGWIQKVTNYPNGNE